ncbi:HlyD family secretion protein [Mariprofundus ferrooxydans]|uniref:HlyD family secretion protein n=1 Tax=Mariprofundus ferrooxydans TaxID=314344 RepID=UPI00142FE045
MSDTTNNETPSADTITNPKLRLRRLTLMIVIPCIAAIVVGIVYLKGGRYIETDNAYVKAEKVAVSPQVSGQITDLLVHENQPVKAGQLLFRIDPAPFQVALDKAEAKLAQVRTDLAVLKASYSEKEAEIALARTNLVFARHDQRRKSTLAANKFISASTLDNAQQSTDTAEQRISVLEKSLARIAATLGGSIDVPIEDHPDYRIAMAEVDQARLMLARTEIRAAQPGIVSKLPKIGQYVSAGSAALMLVVSNNFWVEANFTEKDLTYVHPGQPVTIHIDTYPDTAWTGVVKSLSPATGAEFSVIPAQNATGNWIKIAQRLPVRISIKTTAGKPQLLAGLSTTVEIDTSHHRHILGLSL